MFDPILTAPVAVQVHVFAAVAAVCLTPVQLLRQGGGRWHKRLGYSWVVAMAITALSSFWISEIQLVGPFSPIHLLSAWVLFTLYAAVRAARHGNIGAHRTWLCQCAFWGLGVAGLFTFLPGRRMSETLFPGMPWLGFVAMLMLLCVATVVLGKRQRNLTTLPSPAEHA